MMLPRILLHQVGVLLMVLVATGAWSLLRYPVSHRHCQRQQSLALELSASSAPPVMLYPRAAVSVAVRCAMEAEVYYLLVQRGNEPNKGRWSFPGGKLQLGETALQGGKRELLEETKFPEQVDLHWYPDTIATNDSIIFDNDGTVNVHYLIAICFAELKHVETLPHVEAADDAANAKWWKLQDLVDVDVTPGLLDRIHRTEFWYQKNTLL